MTSHWRAQFELELEKSAAGGFATAGALVNKLMRQGIWRSAANRTGRMMTERGSGAPWARTLSAANRTAKVMSGPTGHALTGYGFAGMLSPLTGIDLPGSNLAFNVAAPGLGALFAAPSLVTSGRMLSRDNQRRLREDVEAGARAGGGDFLSALQMDPSVAWKKGRYGDFMRQHGVDMSQADQYRTGGYKPLSTWDRAGAIFEDPQKLINDRLDEEFYRLTKQSSVGRAIWNGTKKVFPWVFPTLGVGALGHSILRDKPYDEQMVMERGKSLAQAKLQNRLDSMTGIERLIARIDPSIAASAMEKKMPGTISQWEGVTGNQHRPGWLANIVGKVGKDGKPVTPGFYSYASDGSRNYIS